MTVTADLIPVEIDALILLADARRDGRRHVDSGELLEDLVRRGHGRASTYTAAVLTRGLENLRARRLVEGGWLAERWSITDFGALVAEDLRERRP